MTEIKIKPIIEGNVSGELIISNKPLSLLYGIDMNGIVRDIESDIYGEVISGKVLFIPKVKGSTVGCYYLYKLKKVGKSPACFLVKEPDEILVTGCIISNIPLYIVNEIPIKYNRKRVEIDARKGVLIVRNS